MPENFNPESEGGIVGRFSRIAELNAFIESYPYPNNADYERSRLSSEIAHEVLQRTVRVERLDDAPRTAIAGYFLRNPNQLSIFLTEEDEANIRTYEGTTHTYLPNDFFTFRAATQGTVVGIDAPRTSLVIRPSGLRRMSLGRDWARVVDSDGTPLVRLS